MNFSENIIEIDTQSEILCKDEIYFVENNVWEWKRYFYPNKRKFSPNGLVNEIEMQIYAGFLYDARNKL